MTLEQLVPILDLCQQLRDKGFPQDTVFKWFRFTRKEDRIIGDGYSVAQTDGSYYVPVKEVCAAPTAGELEEWLRGKVGNPLEETTIIISHDGSKEVAYSAGVRNTKGKYTIAYGDTDIAALAALVLEVAG